MVYKYLLACKVDLKPVILGSFDIFQLYFTKIYFSSKKLGAVSSVFFGQFLYLLFHTFKIVRTQNHFKIVTKHWIPGLNKIRKQTRRQQNVMKILLEKQIFSLLPANSKMWVIKGNIHALTHARHNHLTAQRNRRA